MPVSPPQSSNLDGASHANSPGKIIGRLLALAIAAALGYAVSGCAAHRETRATNVDPNVDRTGLVPQDNAEPTKSIHHDDIARTSFLDDAEVDGEELSANTPLVEPVEEAILPGEDTVDTLVATALATHPSVHAARERVAAMRHRITQAKALPNPTFKNVFWPIQNQALQTASGRLGNQMAVGQRIPWPKKTQAKGAVACREVWVAMAEVQQVESDIALSVRLACNDLRRVDRLTAVLNENQAVVEGLVAVSRARYQRGGSQQDLLRAQLEGDRLSQESIKLRQRRDEVLADLERLVGRPVSTLSSSSWSVDADDLTAQIEHWVALAEQCNPELSGLSAEISRDRSRQTLACSQKYPDLELGLQWGLISDDRNVVSPVANGHDNISFSVGVTLPIWKSAINAGVSEAGHRRNESVQRKRAERDKIRASIRRQHAALLASSDQIDLLQNRILPRTRQTLEVATAEYRNGSSAFTDLVDVYRELLQTQVMVVESESDLMTSFAELERSIGCAVEISAAADVGGEFAE